MSPWCNLAYYSKYFHLLIMISLFYFGLYSIKTPKRKMKSTIKWLIVISVAVCVNGQSNLGDDINQSDQVILSTDASISLSKCCPDHKLYRPGLDLCRHGLAESRQVTLLPVHSIKTDHHTNFSSPVTFLIEPNDNRMLRADPEKSDMLAPCPAGFVDRGQEFHEFHIVRGFFDRNGQRIDAESGKFLR